MARSKTTKRKKRKKNIRKKKQKTENDRDDLLPHELTQNANQQRYVLRAKVMCLAAIYIKFFNGLNVFAFLMDYAKQTGHIKIGEVRSSLVIWAGRRQTF